MPADDCNARCAIEVRRPNQPKPNILQADQVLLATAACAAHAGVEPWYEGRWRGTGAVSTGLDCSPSCRRLGLGEG